MKIIEKVKKHWIVSFIVLAGAVLGGADKAVTATKDLWLQFFASEKPKIDDRFNLSGVKMAFVVSELSEERIRIVGETIVPIFSNPNYYPVTIQFNRISVSINGKEGPPIPIDDMTKRFPAANGPEGWFGSDPRVQASNGDTLNGFINAQVTYFNQDIGLRKEMTIRGKVIAKLPRRGRIVTIEWYPDPESERATGQRFYKYVVLGPPTIPLSPEDQAVLDGRTVAR